MVNYRSVLDRLSRPTSPIIRGSAAYGRTLEAILAAVAAGPISPDGGTRGRPAFTLLLVGLLCLAAMGPAWAQFQVGMGSRIITPDPLLPVSGGMGPTAAVREKKGDLLARAMVLRSDRQTVAIVSVDLLGFPSVLGNRVRRLVPEIPAEAIVIGASHTHSAPDCYAFPDGQGGHTGDLDYMSWVCREAAAAIKDALGALQPASLRIATGEVQGKIAYNYYAPDLYDRRVNVIQAVTAEGTCIGTLVNFAIHPEVLGADAGILSPDLIGPLRDRIEAQAGGLAMFMNGAQGGMITADNRDLDNPSDTLRGYWHDRRTWDECVRIGQQLADEALRAVKDVPLQHDPRLQCRSRAVRFPVESAQMWAVVAHSPLNYPRNEDQSITSQINLLTLGNSQILTIPGEALPNIGFYLKRKMRGQHNLLFGLTNDAFGYILTRVDFHSFPRYEYVSRVSLGEMTGEILIQEALQMIGEQ